MNSTNGANGAPQFVDTNVLIYAHDATASGKMELAQALTARLWTSRAGCLSVQVLQEFYTVALRRSGSADQVARITAYYAGWYVFAPQAADVLAAIQLHREARISFWDAMIVHAAAASGCAILWTEDLAHGTVLRGVRILNPFRAAA